MNSIRLGLGADAGPLVHVWSLGGGVSVEIRSSVPLTEKHLEMMADYVRLAAKAEASASDGAQAPASAPKMRDMCPQCGELTGGVTDPKAGNLVVCDHCGVLVMYCCDDFGCKLCMIDIDKFTEAERIELIAARRLMLEDRARLR